MKQKIAFDLDETLGTIITDGSSIIGFNIRTGCFDLLLELQEKYKLVLWSVSNRSYVEKVLSFGLKQFFDEVYSWDDIACTWKDIREIDAHYLVDDSEHYWKEARHHGIEDQYIIVPGYGSYEDVKNDLYWINKIKSVLQLR